MYKHAALSPAIQALQQSPTGEAQKQMFEQQLGEQAYAAFGAKFPDLVESIITFKTLDSNPDLGTAFAAFILDMGGESVYVPAVFSDSTLAPLEIMYVKSKDMFLPFTKEWVAETLRSAEGALGEPAKLPDTVATDVDIRNLVIPPTTGRYSYASSGAYKEAAEASAPVGRMISKRANEQAFDPTLWEGFVEQFSRMNGVTPGVALDQGQMSVDEIAKLYKSHAKTWAAPAPAPAAQPGMAPAPQAAPVPQQQPPQPYGKMASMPSKGLFQSMAPHLDDVTSKAIEGAALGGVTGGLTGIYDDDYRGIGSRMAQGALGGSLGSVAGGLIGKGLNARHPEITKGYADEVGQLLGTLGGGISAARPDEPAYAAGSFRYASAEAGLKNLVKHAMAAPAKHEPRLLPYLHAASNVVKTAFAQVLKANPVLLKHAAETYGTDALLGALRTRPETAKTAGRMETQQGSLRIAKDTAGTKAFGTRAPEAFAGVKLRGYFYEDTKKPKNMAVLQQEYHDVHDIREPGVFNLWKTDGSRVPVLAIVNPDCIFDADTPFYPQGDRTVEPRRYAPGTFEVNSDPLASESLRYPGNVTEKSHEVSRLLIFGDGRHLETDCVHGEQLTEAALEGSKVFKHLFSDKPSAPQAGRGIFVRKVGAHYYSTCPMHLSNIQKGSNGTITAKAHMHGPSDYGGKTLRIDPTSPISRMIRPKDSNIVAIPASWRWMPLGERYDDRDILLTASAVIDFGLNTLHAMGAHRTRVKSAGAGLFTFTGKEQLPKHAALQVLATNHDISGADAEAILKIAELQNSCTALIVPTAGVLRMAKFASPVEQAFSEILQGLGSQMENIQGQMQVLQMVQTRAQELAQDPQAMQATDPAMGAPAAPAAPQDNAAAPAPQPMPDSTGPQGGAVPPAAPGQAMLPEDPAMQAPPLPMMTTEGPSAQEIAQQVNPAFLEQAAGLQEAGVFDASVLAELERAAGRVGGADPAPVSENTRELAGTVDDLGRTLLMLQLRQTDLQEQLSDETFKGLEQQVRNTFQGLGTLMLELQQHSAALSHVQDANAT